MISHLLLTVWLLNLTSNDLSCFDQMKIIQKKKKNSSQFFKTLFMVFPFFFLMVLFISIISRLIDHRFTISVWMFPTKNSVLLQILITDILLLGYIKMVSILAVLPKFSSSTLFQ